MSVLESRMPKYSNRAGSVEFALALQIDGRLVFAFEVKVFVDQLEQLSQPGIIHERVAQRQALFVLERC